LLIKVAPDHMVRCLHVDISFKCYIFWRLVLSMVTRNIAQKDSKICLEDSKICLEDSKFCSTMTSMLTKSIDYRLEKTRPLVNHCFVCPKSLPFSHVAQVGLAHSPIILARSQ
jgi:hypothetical protein